MSPKIHFNLLYNIHLLYKLDGMLVYHRDTLVECCQNLFTVIRFEIFSLLKKFCLYLKIFSLLYFIDSGLFFWQGTPCAVFTFLLAHSTIILLAYQ